MTKKDQDKENKSEKMQKPVAFEALKKAIGAPFWMQKRGIDPRWVLISWYDKTLDGEHIGCVDFRGTEFVVEKEKVEKQKTSFWKTAQG